MSALKFKKHFLPHNIRKNVIRENVVTENVIRRDDDDDNDVDDVNGVDESRPADDLSEFWANQCQKYEERIVELHSVIAELTRKLEDSNDVIRWKSYRTFCGRNLRIFVIS
jgi:hypothetical protein